MNQKYISVKLKPLEKNQMPVAIKIKNGQKATQIITKSSNDYLIQFLQSKKTFLKLYAGIEEAMTKALPENVEENCRKCKSHLFNEDSLPKEDAVTILGNCDFYRAQMGVTYLLAANEFVNILNRNRFIVEDERFVKELTFNFFSCFGYVKGEGVMVFDLTKLCKKLLEAGFLLISEIFAKSDALKNLSLINDTIDSIDQSLIQKELNDLEDFDSLELQKRFFMNKRTYYKEELWLNQHKNTTLPNPSTLSVRPNRTDIAYFCYYATKSKEYKTKNLFPSDAAWKEVASKFKKNAKNIQQVYNLIANTQPKRLKRSKITNIKYVLEHMLSDYPKAREIALDELKIAELHS